MGEAGGVADGVELLGQGGVGRRRQTGQAAGAAPDDVLRQQPRQAGDEGGEVGGLAGRAALLLEAHDVEMALDQPAQERHRVLDRLALGAHGP